MRWIEMLVWVIYISCNPNYFPCLSSNVMNMYAFVGVQLCPTFRDPMDCSPPGSSVLRILQARVVKWVAMPSSSSYGWSGGNYWAEGKRQTVVKELPVTGDGSKRAVTRRGDGVVLLEILIGMAANGIVILSEVRGEMSCDIPLCAI